MAAVFQLVPSANSSRTELYELLLLLDLCSVKWHRLLSHCCQA